MKILAKIRLYYNYLLCRMKVRKILPAYFINRIPVCECGEALVDFDRIKVRNTVRDMLIKAQSLLPNGFSIQVVCGWRSKDLQNNLREEILTQFQKQFHHLTTEELQLMLDKFCANVSGHATGGAVDVTLLYRGKIIDCGTAYLEFNERTPIFSQNLSMASYNNRMLLYKAMTTAGFVNYPAEWWHYAYGDKLYAAYSHKRNAIYGAVSN
ncbi:MAG: M15 family metallopeptidase [Victivallaceae bacterium]